MPNVTRELFDEIVKQVLLDHLHSLGVQGITNEIIKGLQHLDIDQMLKAEVLNMHFTVHLPTHIIKKLIEGVQNVQVIEKTNTRYQ